MAGDFEFLSLSGGGDAAVNTGATGATGTVSSASGTDILGYAGLATSIIGAVSSVIGAYSQVDRIKKNLEFSSLVSAANARISAMNLEASEKTAQQYLRAGEQAQMQISLKAAKIKGAQKAGQGARGVQIGVGSAAEEIATTDLMKEIDRNTINANATRAAWNQRLAGVMGQTQTINYATQSAMTAASAEGINPWASAGESLLKSSTQVASNWYSYKKKSYLSNLLSNDNLGGSF